MTQVPIKIRSMDQLILKNTVFTFLARTIENVNTFLY